MKKTTTKKLKTRSRYSKKLPLAIFVLLIAAAGTYRVLFSSAATSCSTSSVCVVFRKNFAADTDHFLTIDDAEAGNYTLEGPAFYAQNSTANGASKVYRLWNGSISAHIYTIDPNYKNNLVASGWADETDKNSPAFYAFWNQVPNSAQVYQLISPSGNDYLYSLDTNEVNTLKAAGWNAAPAFWAYSSNPTPAAPTNAYAAVGAVSHIEGCNYISGWSADPDNYNAQNQVHIYVDNVLYAYGVTNQAAQVAVPGTNHGFWWNIPSTPTSLKAAGTHTVVVWGIDYNSAGQYTGGTKNAIIGQGTYTCSSTATTTTSSTTITNKNSPLGYIDQVSCTQLSGWAYDPDTNPATNKSNDVHVVINGETFNLGPTNLASPDVNAAYGISGNHRFVFAIPSKYQSTDSPIQVYSIDFDSAGNYVPNSSKTVRILNDTLRCAPASSNTSSSAPNNKTAVGTVDIADCSLIKGWSYDEDNKTKPTDIHIGINGQVINTGPTTQYRKDANDAYGLSGNHGFGYTIPDSIKSASKNNYDIKVYAININADGISGGTNTLIWSGSYTCNEAGAKTSTTASSTTTPTGTENKLPPIGSVDSSKCSLLSGWARDPDTTKAIKIHVYVDGKNPVEFTADQNRQDVGLHAFVADLGAQYKDGKRHYADVYGLDYDNAGNYIGYNNALIASVNWACDTSGSAVTPPGDLIDGKCPTSGSLLSKGSTGDEVSRLQNCLKKLGFNIVADGQFGDITDTLLRIFQADFGRSLSCYVGSTFDYSQVVTGKTDATTYKLLSAADSTNWKATASSNYLILDNRSGCDSAPKIISFSTVNPNTGAAGGGITEQRTDQTPSDPPSGLNTTQACTAEIITVVNPFGSIGINYDLGTSNNTTAATYYACMLKANEYQTSYDKYIADNSTNPSLTASYPGLTTAKSLIWSNGVIWNLNTSAGDVIYDKLKSDALNDLNSKLNNVSLENTKRPCTLWLLSTYKSAGWYYRPLKIGDYTKQECIDIANSTDVAIGNIDSNTGAVYYEIYYTANGKRKYLDAFVYPVEQVSHMDWNGGSTEPNGIQVKDFIP